MKRISNKSELNTQGTYVFINQEENTRFKVVNIEPCIDIILIDANNEESVLLADELASGYVFELPLV